MAKMFHDSAHFAVLAFANGHLKPGIAGHLAIKTRVNVTIANAVNGNAIGQTCQRIGINLPLNTNAVFAAPSCTWQFQMPGQTAIIGQQQQAFRIHIQPPNRQHPRKRGRQRIKDRLAVLFIPAPLPPARVACYTATVLLAHAGSGVPLTVMMSADVTFSAGLSMISPFTETRPSAISASAARREQIPARAMCLAMRSGSPLAESVNEGVVAMALV